MRCIQNICSHPLQVHSLGPVFGLFIPCRLRWSFAHAAPVHCACLGRLILDGSQLPASMSPEGRLECISASGAIAILLML